MKNIHVLPIDKPSRLWVNNLLQGKLELSEEVLPFNTAQHISITNDEEIKDGDWVYSEARKTWFKIKSKATTSSGIILIEDNVIMRLEINEVDCKKIILTTDQDLIKDGIQPIPDDFLEWFIKNPSCEGVEVEKLYQCPVMNKSYDKPYISYKIIIPKEERMYSEEEVKKAQQAILGNIKDALQDENYIIEYLEQFKNK